MAPAVKDYLHVNMSVQNGALALGSQWMNMLPTPAKLVMSTPAGQCHAV